MLPSCNRAFIRQALAENLRLDNRSCREFRPINISYDRIKGSCHVKLGNTWVVSHVSWEVVVPKETRPNEGMLTVNVELPPFMAGRQTSSEMVVLTNICVERGLRDSKCLDLESLCIESAFKVFSIRIDLHVLNYDGNHIDALLLCGLAALKHFRRPDVTYSGIESIIHLEEEKDPLALTVLHMPVSTTLALFVENSNTTLVADPTDDEEKASDSKIMVVANKHEELCFIKTIGCQLSLTKEILFKCCRLAVERAKQVSENIEEALASDSKKRESSRTFEGVSMIMQNDAKDVNCMQKNLENELENIKMCT